MKQEYQKVFPQFDLVLEAFRQERQRYDEITDVNASLQQKVPTIVQEHGTRRLLEVLLESSSIGVRVGRAGETRFKSEYPDLVLPQSGAIYVHPALHKGLSIREVRRPSQRQRQELKGRIDALSVKLLNRMLTALPMQDLGWFQLQPRPVDVIVAETFEQCAARLGLVLVADDSISDLAVPNRIKSTRLTQDTSLYVYLRNDMLRLVSEEGFLPSEYVRGASDSE